ncbi:1-aminocyclopropane-1-carboxylate oxidase [Glycine max]|nr:1-aminocyclopropane-1-carboxylate oxidase [Glycine max]
MDLQNLLTHDYMNENKLLEEACKYWSLFRLVNHGVPSTLLTKLHDQAKQFFSLSFESKQASCSANPLSQFQSQLPQLHSFRLLHVEYGENLTRIATTLFEAMMKNLDMNFKYSNSYAADNTGIVCLSLSNLFQCWFGNGGVHTGSSVLAILNQENEVSGIEVLKDNQWF